MGSYMVVSKIVFMVCGNLCHAHFHDVDMMQILPYQVSGTTIGR